MKTVARFLLTAFLMTAVGGQLTAQPPGGSQLPPDENHCATCHGEKALWEGETLRLYVPQKSLANDIHWQKGVNCHDCHGGDPSTFEPGEAHPTDIEPGKSKIIPFRKLAEVKKLCGVCHQDQLNELRMGDAHNTAGERNAQGRGTPLECMKCHGVIEDGKRVDKVHGMRSVRDEQSPVFLDHQINVCGACHEEHFDTYVRSVHGLGLLESGLLNTAACADCHGAHGVYYKNDDRNPLYPSNVAETCGKCHRFVEEKVQRSVHGHSHGAGKSADRRTPGGEGRTIPTCTDCHQRHDLAEPKSTAFRVRLPNRCGNCHAGRSEYYAMTIHGELTALGYGPAAKCSDCHGAHDILPVSDPASRLFHDPQRPAADDNRTRICRTCHPYATGNFMDFDPHADYKDPQRDPLLHGVYTGLLTLLISVFSFFGLHSVLWCVRSLVHLLKHGRPRPPVPGAVVYVRFGQFHRVAHTLMLISFLGLALTGMPLKYSHHEWARSLAYYLGGFDSTRIWHRVFGVMNICLLVVYVVRMHLRMAIGRKRGATWGELIFGPDSPVPNFRDVKDFLLMIRWFVGLGPKPTFERWTYWEKFDFWGACADIGIIGFTGLVLWFPVIFCSFLPGSMLNIAKVVHSTQALLATGFVFAIHFFNTHLRPGKFPMDTSILTGLVGEGELREERPEYLARIRQERLRQIEAAGIDQQSLESVERARREGKLDETYTVFPTRFGLWCRMLGGFLALAVGLSLLAGMILAGLGG